MAWVKRECYVVTAFYPDDVAEETGTISDERIFTDRYKAVEYMRECEDSEDYECVCLEEDEREVLEEDEEDLEL